MNIYVSLFYFFKNFKINIPEKYKNRIAEDKINCVIGSVEGVITALKMVAIKKIYFQDLSI